jgi:hypothetical protein
MPTIFAVVLALSAVQTSPSPAPLQPSPAQKEAFARVLRRAPAFTAGTGRELGTVRLGMALADTDNKAFIVEFGWKEKGTQHTGIAGFVDEAALRARAPENVSKAIAREGGWLLVKLVENATWDEMIKGMADSRRSANESAAIGDVRSVIGGQAVYKSATKAYAPTLACLGRPADCIPGYNGPSDFISADLASSADRMAYRRALHVGRKAPGPAGAYGVETWAYTAVPAEPGQGWRAFCGDQTGVVCAVADGTMPPITGGACPRTCEAVP